MKPSTRKPEQIQAQIDAFRATLPDGWETPPPIDDFAATVQWRAWQDHLNELETELRRSRFLQSLTTPQFTDLTVGSTVAPVRTSKISFGTTVDLGLAATVGRMAAYAGFTSMSLATQPKGALATEQEDLEFLHDVGKEITSPEGVLRPLVASTLSIAAPDAIRTLIADHGFLSDWMLNCAGRMASSFRELGLSAPAEDTHQAIFASHPENLSSVDGALAWVLALTMRGAIEVLNVEAHATKKMETERTIAGFASILPIADRRELARKDFAALMKELASQMVSSQGMESDSRVMKVSQPIWARHPVIPGSKVLLCLFVFQAFTCSSQALSELLRQKLRDLNTDEQIILGIE